MKQQSNHVIEVDHMSRWWLVLLIGVGAISGISCTHDSADDRSRVAALIQKHSEEVRDDPLNAEAWNTYKRHLYSDWRFERIYAVAEISSFGETDPRAIEELIKLLACGDYGVEQEAINTLGDVGPNAHAAIPALLVIAQSKDATMKGSAIDAIGRIAEPTPEVISIVEAASQSESEHVRRIAIVALSDLKKRQAEENAKESDPGSNSTRNEIE